jgi:preprotein translocase subunit SecG
MSIIKFILGLVVLAASLVVSCACYIVKNEKGGLNAALGGASDFMTTRRNDNNLKVNKFVVKVGVVLTIAILALTIIGAHF